MDAIRVHKISKSYGSVRALDDVSLVVPKGSIYALLGPNGAGKTTLIRILTTILQASEGDATVAGASVQRQPARVRERIGLAGQYAAVDEMLTGRENLIMIGKLYGQSAKEAARRAEDALRKLDLLDAADRQANTYSGGMRRRLDLGASFMNDPKVLFLDEPTEGLDVRARMQLWEIIREIVHNGTTVLLTTHFLEEAESLADRVAVIDHGKLIAEGTIKELKQRVGGERLYVRIMQMSQRKKAKAILEKLAAGLVSINDETQEVIVTLQSMHELTKYLQVLDENKIEIAEIAVHTPSLEEVFLKITERAS